jgi:hypothetical protein
VVFAVELGHWTLVLRVIFIAVAFTRIFHREFSLPGVSHPFSATVLQWHTPSLRLSGCVLDFFMVLSFCSVFVA